MSQVNRRRLSLFSFGANNTNNHTHASQPSLSQSQGSDESQSDPGNSKGGKPSKLSVDPVNNQLSSPVNSPTSGDSELNIFERSVQDTTPVLSARRSTLTRLKSNQRANSSISLSNFKPEDYVPPALDATTQALADSKTNLDDVEMIYSSRRNSSVMGLNMALGRPGPFRKDSVHSISQMNGALDMNTSTSLNHPISPTSPPKLTSSKSSISFYSYADLLSNDEFAKRPNFKQSYSHGIIPTSRRNSNFSTTNVQNSTNTKRFNSSLNRFLISPESSDSEDDSHSKFSGKSKTTSTAMMNDEESLISSSIGDCLRQTTTEINNS